MTKVIWDMSHLGKKEGELYLNKKCSHAKNEITYFQHNHQCFSISDCGHYGDLLSTILVQGDAKENFNHHLELIKSHCHIE
jgi:hypothetical protein